MVGAIDVVDAFIAVGADVGVPLVGDVAVAAGTEVAGNEVTDVDWAFVDERDMLESVAGIAERVSVLL